MLSVGGFGFQGVRVRLQGAGLRSEVLWSSVEDAGLRFQGVGFRVWGLGLRFRIQGLGFMVHDFGFRFQG